MSKSQPKFLLGVEIERVLQQGNQFDNPFNRPDDYCAHARRGEKKVCYAVTIKGNPLPFVYYCLPSTFGVEIRSKKVDVMYYDGDNRYICIDGLARDQEIGVVKLITESNV